MKRHELLLMLLPCLLLAGTAFYLTRHEAKPTPDGPLRVVLDEVKIIPATPREVAQGCDLTMLIKARMLGPASMDFTQPSSFNYLVNMGAKVVDAKGNQVQVPPSNGGFAARDQQSAHVISEQATYPLRLRDVPRDKGALYFRVIVNGYAVDSGKNNDIYLRSAPRNFLVRRKGEVIAPPRVSKYRPFSLTGYRTHWSTEPGKQICTVEMTAETFEEARKTEGRSSIRLDKVQLTGDKKPLPQVGLSFHGWDKGTATISQQVDVPNAARDVTFKANLSLNECWPMPLEVALRKNGKNITRDKPGF